MKCPKCHNEVCNQRVCPYCGATVYLEDSSWETEKLRHGNITPAVPGKDETEKMEDLLGRIRKLETRVNLILVLNAALFALVILLLVVQLEAM